MLKHNEGLQSTSLTLSDVRTRGIPASKRESVTRGWSILWTREATMWKLSGSLVLLSLFGTVIYFRVSNGLLALLVSGEKLPDKPVQLIYPDSDHETLVIDEDNLSFLLAIKEPVAVVSGKL